MSHIWTDVCSILFAFASVFLIFIILLQRGRGGGLAGAFGATGGQSAFGTKAGDVFTKITIVVAVIWVALAAVTGFAMTRESRGRLEFHDVAEPVLVPANPPKNNAGGAVNEFEAGTKETKTAPATKGAAAKESKQPGGAASPSTATPAPAKTSPPADGTKQPASTK